MRGIDISIKRQAAGTVMSPNSQTFADSLSTAATDLACVSWVNGDNLCASFFRFVLKYSPKFAQRRIMRGQGQVTVSGHEQEIQLFNGDIAVGINDPTGRLVPEVPACITCFLMLFSDLLDCLAPVRSAFRATGHTPLGDAQFPQVGLQPTWVINRIWRWNSPIREAVQRAT
jgi:hypothetical protein